MRATRPIRSLKVLFPCFVISFAVACHSSRPQRKSDPNAEEHVRQLIKSLPPGSEIRHRLEVGDRGDGLHYTWMDDMRGRGLSALLSRVILSGFFVLYTCRSSGSCIVASMIAPMSKLPI